MVYDWDWIGAERELRRALELNPSSSLAHQTYGYLSFVLGRSEAAIEHYDHASKLDPLSLIVPAQAGFALYMAGRNQEAIEKLRSTARLDSTFYYPRIFLGLAYVQGGDAARGAAELESAARMLPNPVSVSQMAYGLAKAGRTADARRALETLVERGRTEFIPEYEVALVHIALGDNERAFMAFERAFQQKGESLILLKVDPRLEPIRSDPRYRAMLRRIGLASS